MKINWRLPPECFDELFVLVKNHITKYNTNVRLMWQMQSHLTEAVSRRCSIKKVFLEISQNSQENTCARVSFLIKLQASVCNIIKKETLTGVFLWALQNFKEHFNLQKTPPVAASVYLHFCCWLGFHGFLSIRFV